VFKLEYLGTDTCVQFSYLPVKTIESLCKLGVVDMFRIYTLDFVCVLYYILCLIKYNFYLLLIIKFMNVNMRLCLKWYNKYVV